MSKYYEEYGARIWNIIEHEFFDNINTKVIMKISRFNIAEMKKKTKLFQQ